MATYWEYKNPDTGLYEDHLVAYHYDRGENPDGLLSLCYECAKEVPSEFAALEFINNLQCEMCGLFSQQDDGL